jgi:hypothetical protein
MIDPVTFQDILPRLSRFFRFVFFLTLTILIFSQKSAALFNFNNSSKPPLTIHIVQMIIGDGSTNLGYNVISPAYDIALQKASQQYPRAFANQAVTRYFVPGQYSCAESTGMATAGFHHLLAPKDQSKDSNEFRIVLSPGSQIIRTITIKLE